MSKYRYFLLFVFAAFVLAVFTMIVGSPSFPSVVLGQSIDVQNADIGQESGFQRSMRQSFAPAEGSSASFVPYSSPANPGVGVSNGGFNGGPGDNSGESSLASAPGTQSAPGTELAPDTQPAPDSQFLLKLDGTMLEGKINVAGGYYTVEVAGGKGILYVRKEQVFKVVDTIAQAYLVKVKSMVYQDAREYLSLADWCIQNQLFPQAQEALNQAKSLQNNHPMIKVYQSRLETAQNLAKRQAEKYQQRQNQAAAQKSQQPDSLTVAEDSQPPLTRQEEASRQIQLQQNALEQMARNMPGDTLKQFTSEIQPMLISGCGTASCHGAGSQSDFRIIASPTKTRNLTLRNLYSVLRQVDRDNPQESAILSKAVEAHGQMDLPVFTRNRASAYSRLVGWTYRVTRPARIYSVEQTQYLDRTIGREATIQEPENPFEKAFWENAENAEIAESPKGTGNGQEKESEHGAVMQKARTTDDRRNAIQSAGSGDWERTGGSDVPADSARQTTNAEGIGKTGVKRGNPLPESYEAMDPFDPNTFNQLQAEGQGGRGQQTHSVTPNGAGNGLAPGSMVQSAFGPGESGSATVQFTPDGSIVSGQNAAVNPFSAADASATHSNSYPVSNEQAGNASNYNVQESSAQGANAAFHPSAIPGNGVQFQPSITSESSVVTAPASLGGVNNAQGGAMAQPNYGVQTGPTASPYMQTPAQQMLQSQQNPEEDEPITIIRNGKVISGGSDDSGSALTDVPAPIARPKPAERSRRKYSSSPEDAGYDELPRVDLLFGAGE